MRSLSSEARTRIANAGSQSLANLAWAFSPLYLRDVPLLGAIAYSSLRKLSDFQPQSLANTVWAFATLKFYPSEPLMHSIAAASIAKIDSFRPQELGTTAWSYAELSFKHCPLSEAISTASSATIDSRAAGLILEGLARGGAVEFALMYLDRLEASGHRPGGLGLGALMAQLELQRGLGALAAEPRLFSSLARWSSPRLLQAATAAAATIGSDALVEQQGGAVLGKPGKLEAWSYKASMNYGSTRTFPRQLLRAWGQQKGHIA